MNHLERLEEHGGQKAVQIMGAPKGHPFLGNQYTDGGYVKGSFTYKAAASASASAEAVSNTSNAVSAAIRDSISQASKKPAPFAAPGMAVSTLIATGTAVVVGGLLAYAYLRNRPGVEEPIPQEDDLANFGVCEHCAHPLGSDGPAELEQDEQGDFLVCENCNQINRAKYKEEQG